MACRGGSTNWTNFTNKLSNTDREPSVRGGTSTAHKFSHLVVFKLQRCLLQQGAAAVGR